MPAAFVLLIVLFVATTLALATSQRTVGAEDRLTGLFKATLILLGTTLIAAPCTADILLTHRARTLDLRPIN